MYKRIIIFFIGLFSLLSTSTLTFASKINYNNSTPKLDRINFNNLTIKDGLTSNIITCIYQDSKGYMWIGTQDGLNKYNGNIVIPYKYEKNNSKSLTSTCITSINEDAYGNIWVGTDSGLNIINVNKDEVIKLESNKGKDDILSDYIITSIYRDSNNTMWIGTSNGLNRYDEKSNKFIKYYSDNTSNSITNSYITDIDESHEEELWVSTMNGITIIDLSTYNISFEREKYNNFEYIYNVDKDNKGDMWVLSKKGLFKVNSKTYEIEAHNIDDDKELSKDIKKVLAHNNGDIWLAHGSDLIRYSEDTNETKIYTKDSNLLASDLVSCLYEDRNGIIWIGTNNGIFILNAKQQFTTTINNLLLKNNLCGSSIKSFLQDSDDDLWIGTEEYGVIQVDISENKIIRFICYENNPNSLLSNSIKYIEEGINNNIIVVTEKGINIINKNSKDVISYPYEEIKLNLFFNKDLKIMRDEKYVWTATEDGLYRYDKESKVTINFINSFREKGIDDYRIFDIFQDENDKDIIWLAGGNGVGLIKFHKNEGIIKNYLSTSDENSMSYDSINCIQGDGRGNLWIGTEVGLNKFNIDEETFTKYYDKDGLVSNYINSIILDDNDDIWIGTNKGLSKFIVEENRFINFTEMDGLCGNQFNKGSIYKTKEGILIFGTTKGIVSFNPNDIQEIATKENKVVLDNIWINRDSLTNYSDNIELKYYENNISIQYFLPDYSRIGGITYLYKMDGLNKEWNVSNKDGYVIYTNLEPGNYTFRVKAVNSDGSFTDESIINIVIKKPFWESNIAYFIYIGTILFIVLYIVFRIKFFKKLIATQTRKIKQQMEENQRLYERSIKNEKFKNDYFVNLSHELRTPINVILSALQVLNSLEKSGTNTKEKNLSYMKMIEKNSNNLLNIINDIIDSSKIESGAYKIDKEENVDIVYLVEETALNMSEYINSKGINLIVDPEIEELSICCDSKEVGRCVINLIGNAVKFTPEGGEIKVLIKEEDNNVNISIEDTGFGISKEDQEFIFKRFEQGENVNSTQVTSSGIGLTLVKYIVELHDGHVKLESELNKGSKFTIVLPLA